MLVIRFFICKKCRARDQKGQDRERCARDGKGVEREVQRLYVYTLMEWLAE
jgi:hypothetical protein